MAMRDAASGGVGSVCCTYAGIPFDTVRTTPPIVARAAITEACDVLQVKLRMQMLSGQAAPRGCVSVALDMGRREGLRTRQRPASPQSTAPLRP